jgi:hypothetical protein
MCSACMHATTPWRLVQSKQRDVHDRAQRAMCTQGGECTSRTLGVCDHPGVPAKYVCWLTSPSTLQRECHPGSYRKFSAHAASLSPSSLGVTARRPAQAPRACRGLHPDDRKTSRRASALSNAPATLAATHSSNSSHSFASARSSRECSGPATFGLGHASSQTRVASLSPGSTGSPLAAAAMFPLQRRPIKASTQCQPCRATQLSSAEVWSALQRPAADTARASSTPVQQRAHVRVLMQRRRSDHTVRSCVHESWSLVVRVQWHGGSHAHAGCPNELTAVKP